MTREQVEGYLREHAIAYEILIFEEKWDFNTSEIAAALALSPEEVVKKEYLKVEDRFILVVLPADWMIDLARMKEILQTREVSKATREEVRAVCTNYETIFSMEGEHSLSVYADVTLLEKEAIVFQLGDWRQFLKMRFEDLSRLVHPVIGDYHLRALRVTNIY